MAVKVPRFTVQAREAAALSRAQRSDMLRQDFGTLQVFVTRKNQNAFGWEIRRFGAVVVFESSSTFETFIAANEAGASFLSSSVTSANEEATASA